MKKYIIYILLILLGAILGWGISGGFKTPNSEASEHQHSHEGKEEIWTCSMHPQIRQDHPGKCPICGMELIPASQVEKGDKSTFKMSEEAIRIANIQTSVIGSNSTNKRLQLSGKIKADERRESSIVTHFTGRIEQLYVSFTGEQIRKGQKIAELYAPELIAAQQELLEAYQIKGTSPELFRAAKQKLLALKISESQIQQVLERQNIQENFVIYAEQSGAINQKKISVGDYLKRGQVLFTLQDLSKVWVEFDVYEQDLELLNSHGVLNFTTPALPNETFTAKVEFVDPIIQATSRTAKVRATLNNSQQKLKPEMFVEGTFEGLQQAHSQILVPKSAVLWTGERSVVYLKKQDETAPTFEYKTIEIGNAYRDQYEVLNGLNIGDEVVTNGAFVLDASAQLNNQYSMMNQNLLSATSDSEIKTFKNTTSKTFKKQLNQTLLSYLELKNALAADDQEKAIEALNKFVQALNKVDMNLVKGDAHITWMKLKKELDSDIEVIQNNDELDQMRKGFIQLSDHWITCLKTFGIENKLLYVQYCPMADNNKGASWISEEEDIINPYYGSSMLSCGEIVDTIKE
ncbi:membrane fusion protein, Cu(I)/Ag(I) efflux system [Lishizhenia tianjinensis]|uniref:Membrane fusion protein, Cu(I)/Ag(I) efflux system n=1 Tax=Lishizhenia tianjinensis TaxID=477690 RepID=A0A1I6YC95_9FLAO|nr:efflux RND transporter periplasmic adaptor subunit [Lishizhenia tianjinensis]SFT48113.1 membrane fusion protein, Cu(I)/Ag(I) efflux system [Lishizhenia tianjinensis]